MTILVVGMGEVGRPLFELLMSKNPKRTVGLDTDDSKCMSTHLLKSDERVNLMNICFGYTDTFITHVLDYIKRYNPEVVVIHSTVKPGTTELIQNKVSMPVIYSPVRGLHKSMKDHMTSYTKFYAYYQSNGYADKLFEDYFGKIMKVKRCSTPLVLEYAKILVDTSYYGYLIAYAQYTNEICMKNGLDYDELWDFAAEIHEKRGDRPKMYPGVIGGHCVVPNAEIINDEMMNALINQNNRYSDLLEGIKSHGQKVKKPTVQNAVSKDATIGENVQIWNYAYVGRDTVIGNNVKIGSLAHIDFGVKIGNNVKIEGQAYIPPLTVIGDNVFIGPRVAFTNDRYPMNDLMEGTVVEDGAIISAGAVIGPGLILGKNCVVGMGAVVTRSVPPDIVVMGVPARPVYDRQVYEMKKREWTARNRRDLLY